MYYRAATSININRVFRKCRPERYHTQSRQKRTPRTRKRPENRVCVLFFLLCSNTRTTNTKLNRRQITGA